VEACIAAGVNITYKILYNGHVSMTGGQDVIGATPIPDLTRKLQAEGVERTVVLAEEPGKYAGAKLASNAAVRDRNELPRTLKELESIPGVTVIIYDQECAAEKRRKRSRGKLPEPVERIVINEEVCEGCGDCVKQSNCVSLQPVATPLGQKMRIHQSSCNKDYSCVLGDCPSFVTVKVQPGTGLAKPVLPKLPNTEVTEPISKTTAGDGYRIIMPGIGGTGVVTINALLATAALIDGKNVHTLDQTGLAQKGGAVVSHIVISDHPIQTTAKINSANADLLIGFDLLGAVNPENLKCAGQNKTVAVINTHITPTPDSIRQRIVLSGAELMIDQINQSTIRGRNLFVDASRLSDELFGSHMPVNIFQLGVAYQAGLIPLKASSIEEAIRVNDVSFEKNLQAFLWGRKYYNDAAWVEQHCKGKTETKPELNRAEELARYQNKAYASEYEAFIQKIPDPVLRETVARYLYKLMAYKDEYEVARLLTKPQFESSARGMWQAPQSITYNLHPPLLRSFGVKRKLQLGPWFRTPLRILAAAKFLRGTPFDIFGMSRHRREERALIQWYRDLVGQVIENAVPENQALALEIVALPDQIRGYERIKDESIQRTKELAKVKLVELTSRTVIDAPATPAGRLQ
jgi:indolepyruvate ferredoxin oxidoreductase